MDVTDEFALYGKVYHVAWKYAYKEKDYLSKTLDMWTTRSQYLCCTRRWQVSVQKISNDYQIVSTSILVSFQIRKFDITGDIWELLDC